MLTIFPKSVAFGKIPGFMQMKISNGELVE
jgi:hypothetical protein